jgi:hypothetical protein
MVKHVVKIGFTLRWIEYPEPCVHADASILDGKAYHPIGPCITIGKGNELTDEGCGTIRSCIRHPFLLTDNIVLNVFDSCNLG